MQVSVKSPIPFPVQNVYEAMRDHMPELAQFMPNINSIEVKERRQQDNVLHIVNRWNPSSTEVPSVAKSFIELDENRTEMRSEGELTLNLKGLVPRLFLGKATSSVERFVGKLVEPNFQKTAQALTDYLRSKS